MAKKVSIVMGTVKDGDNEGSSTKTLARKIYDIIVGATSIYNVSITKYGKIALACIVYEG